ncbi:hypothetical protein GCM10028800_17640 [Nesterenkonia populi]
MLAMAAMGVAGLLVGSLLRPGAGSLHERSDVEGDAALAGAALEHIPQSEVYALSVAEVTPEGSRTATVGAPLEGTFEIGSVTKPITGMLYQDAVERGEVEPHTDLGVIFGLEGDSGEVTLEELSQHRSGLPRLATGPQELFRSLTYGLLAVNPYSSAPEDIPQQVQGAGVGKKEPEYSNLGYAALGHALAEAAGEEYPDLLRERIAEPLALPSFYAPEGGAEGLDSRAVQGRDAAGRAHQPWADPGMAPAGGIRADAQSMALFAEALLNGTAPGAEAMEPRTVFEEDQIGAGWLTSQDEGRTITWHNGRTGGFSTWFGLDHNRGTAVFISGATDSSLNEAGRVLLREAGE